MVVAKRDQRAKQANATAISHTFWFRADNPLRTLGDINLWIDSTAYNIVEMTHHVWLLAIIDYLIEQKR